eukprot:490053_1
MAGLQKHLQSTHVDLFLNQFQWLDNWMLYLPLTVPTLPSGQSRSRCCKLLIVLLNIAAVSLAAWVCWYQISFSVKPYFNSKNIVIFIGIVIGMTFFCITRILSLIYFYFYFKYPWHINSNALHFTDTEKRIIHRFKMFIKCSILLYLIVSVFMNIIEIIWKTNDYGNFFYNVF